MKKRLSIILFFGIFFQYTHGQIQEVKRDIVCAVCKISKPAKDYSGNSHICKSCVSKAEVEKKRRQEAERKAQEEAEKERIANEQKDRERAEKERLEREKREKQDRIARENAEIIRKANSMNDLEKNFNNGSVDIQNALEQFKWYSKAAELGDARAQTNLGILYKQGHAVKRDLSEAVRLFRKAANQGYAKGQNCLGVMYLNGYGVTKDESEAFKLFRKAAEQGNPYGQYNLARMYQYKDKFRNLSQAQIWYEKAAAQGHEKAKLYLKNVGQYVDLDLPSGTLWATCNLGANYPEHSGAYYCWGETEWTNENQGGNLVLDGSKREGYKWGLNNHWTKYNLTDKKTELDLEDDAAYINWGKDWCMPTIDQIMELEQKCKWEYGLSGYKIIGKNGNSIYLPIIHKIGYWSRNKSKNDEYERVCGRKGVHGMYDKKKEYYLMYRNCYCFIRPVRIKK